MLAILCGSTDTGRPDATDMEVSRRGRAFGCIGKSPVRTLDQEPHGRRDAQDQKTKRGQELGAR
jgi:hypothetical protein